VTWVREEEEEKEERRRSVGCVGIGFCFFV